VKAAEDRAAAQRERVSRFMAWVTSMRVLLAAGAVVVVAGVVGLVMLLNQPSTSSYSSSTYNPATYTPPPYTPPAPQPIQPEPVQPAPAPNTSNYSNLSGSWIDSNGGYAQVSVSPDGVVQGQVTSGPFIGHGMGGEFYGTDFEFALVHPQLGVVAGGAGQLTDACHIAYTSMDTTGAVIGQGVIHINHQPNDPCPPQGR
jgi:hypothetical protein